MKKIGEWRLLVGTLCLLAGWLTGHAEVADSVQTKDLNELVVTAKRGWIEDDKIVYIPTKTEQKLSNSPETLIESMHLPMLIVKDGSITTVSGETVSIFINGNPANATDLATFWPKQAKRVEFMRNPSDAKFQGAQNVVNFIMQEYEVGGVTKAEVYPAIPNKISGKVSSKLVYKKLQLGLKAGVGNQINNRDYTQKYSTYKDLYYKNTYYDTILMVENEHSKRKSLFADMTFNATLTLPKGRFDQALTWSWLKRHSFSHGDGVWNPMLFSSNDQWSKNRGKNNAISYLASYWHQFNSKWFLSGSLSYSHGHTDSYSVFQTSDLPCVENIAEDNSNTFGVAVKSTWYASKKVTMAIKLNNNSTWYKTLYRGSANNNIDQTRNETSAELTFWWKPINALTLIAYPGMNILHTKIASDKITYISPAGNIALFWTASNKFSMYGFAYYLRSNPAASETAPVTIRTSELLWTEGNPYLKPEESINFYISPTYIPTEWFSLGAYIGVFKTIHPRGFTYSSAPKEMEGLIVSRVSFPSSEQYIANANLNFALFKRKLNIGVQPSFTHWLARPEGRRRMSEFSCNLSADYVLGNCRANLSYHSSSKGLFGNGDSYKSDDSLDFGFTWGTGNLYLSLQCLNVLRNKTCVISTSEATSYSEYSYQYTTGRQLNISMSYTFGYGKKLDRNIDILEGTSVGSSILNTK